MTRPVAWLYAWLAQRAHSNSLAKRQALLVPVVVVGNVLVGGTGKTPVVAAVVAHLQATGMRPGIVARGYKATSPAHAQRGLASTPTLVNAGSSAQSCGDEPKLLFELTQVPVCVHSQRLLAAQHLLAQHPEVNVIVSDDGLQHAALPRSIEIVVFDERATGNGQLLPAGLLREPWPRRAEQQAAAHCLVVQNGVSAPTVDALNPGDPVFASLRVLGELHPLLPNKASCAVPVAGDTVQILAGIAKPQAFAAMLRSQGFIVAHTALVADHDALDGAWPYSFGLNPDLPTICTAKDAVKLRARPDAAQLNMWVAPLSVQLPTAFWTTFDQCMSQLAHPNTPG
ncbi:tetraacyldisaccharide 4'-kinase [Comamonadaceae bacterium M7527]|nr:tetraacyldisaccharide 4'-kinase [Comamonadaceae bacterium M7527]